MYLDVLRPKSSVKKIKKLAQNIQVQIRKLCEHFHHKKQFPTRLQAKLGRRVVCHWQTYLETGHTGLQIERSSKGPFTPETRSTPAHSRSGKMDGSAMSGPWSGRAYVGLKYSGGWSGPLWEVVVSGISFSTGWKMVGDDPALHRSYVERGYSVVVGGTA